ncbi:hypothetical protein BJV82DRAFT_583729 [Fennellomyces sp. T-0311]|nr:hypothetical protein BJV82DRAFT_583729 [Fennellomyces sp. T-0311]
MLTIDNFIRNQREAILYSTEIQKFGDDPYMAANDKAVLVELLGKVSRYAIDKIKMECAKRTKSTKPNINCTCPVRINFNIPCKHLLVNQSVISLSSVPARWHLNEKQSEPTQDQLTKLVNNVTSIPALKELNEPAPLKSSKGRPKGTKRLPLAIELKEKTIAAHEKAEKKRKKKTIEENRVKKIKLTVNNGVGQSNINKCDEEDDQESVIFDERASSIPADLPPSVVINGISVDGLLDKKFVNTVWDVKGDGHAPITEYTESIAAVVGKTFSTNSILVTYSISNNSLTTTTPDCAQIAADAFLTPIAIYTGTGRFAQLFLPIGFNVPDILPKPIIMQLVRRNHFVLIQLHDNLSDFILPPLNAAHKIACTVLEHDDHWATQFNS